MATAPQKAGASARAPALHAQSVVIDGLITSHLTQEQFERFRAWGVTAANWTAVYFAHDLDDALVDLATALDHLAGMTEYYTSVRSVADIHQAKREGKVGVILGLQNGRPIGDRLEYVRILHALGVRIIQLTYNERNFIGDGCTEPGDAGLSRFGRDAVRAMNRVGILVDLSHCGLRTTREVIEWSEKPVAITHANPSTLIRSPRNKPPEIFKALAERGGVAGMCAWSPLAAHPASERPTLEKFLDIIDYTVNLIGVDHVGFGTDHGEGVYTRDVWERKWGPQGLYPEVTGIVGPWFGFETRYVDGIHSAALLGNLTEGLLRRGYSDEDAQKIIGGNFLRLLGEVWQ
ncbi:MAG: membrane dipeptidase [Armatimonadetes bacterium]|nr:membrane dipeptidase [Armatimonadota bacterium]